jgi:hypothetical protein
MTQECKIEYFSPGPSGHPKIGQWIQTNWGDDLGYSECIAKVDRISKLSDRVFTRLRVISLIHEVECENIMVPPNKDLNELI